MADNRHAGADGILPQTVQGTLDEMDVLLETGAVRPDEGAMSVFQQALAGLWAAEADQPKTATRNSLFTAFQSLGQHYPKRRGPVNQFRPSLEDLGPRELSAFPVNPLGASMAGAASVSIVVVASPTAPLTPSQPAATAGAWDFRNDLAAAAACPGDHSAMDQVWTDGRPAFVVGDGPLLPEWGAVLLLGGLRQDRDQEQSCAVPSRSLCGALCQ